MTKQTKKQDAQLGALVRYSPCEEGDYGLVLVMAGKHCGKIALYDDDEDRRAIIYFGVVGDEDLIGVEIKRSLLARLPDDFCTFVTDWQPPSFIDVRVKTSPLVEGEDEAEDDGSIH